MGAEPKKRPRRIPYTPKEVANIIAVKKRRELIKLQTFTASLTYKIQNSFNIICFFMYWEIIFCFFGPANYTRHYSYGIETKYGQRYDLKAKPVISEIEFKALNGKTYTYIIDDFISIPPKFAQLSIGSDFLLNKELKGQFNTNKTDYRLFAASPLMLIIILAILTSSLAYTYNLNQNAYSLMAITVLNSMCLLGIMAI
jgi:hypothetical protein